WNHYAPDPKTCDEITASPLRATLDQLCDLPPALVVTAENDPLRDEGEAYAAKLMEAGVSVIATRYVGAIHGFTSINALANTPPTRGAIAQICNFLQAHLFASP